jgi:hypothetical protein
MTMRKKGGATALRSALGAATAAAREPRNTLATKTFSTRCGTLNYHRLGSKTFGENEPVCRHTSSKEALNLRAPAALSAS